MDAITGHLNWIVLAIAAAIFLARGLWLPFQDTDTFVRATVKHNPKLQCLALAALGYGLTGVIEGTAAAWITTGRAWLIDALTGGGSWAFGTVGGLAVAIAGVLIWFDYIVPGGLEPSQSKPVGHMVMWVISLLLYPLMTLMLGSISLLSFLIIFAAMWLINTKFRSKKPAQATIRPAGSPR